MKHILLIGILGLSFLLPATLPVGFLPIAAAHIPPQTLSTRTLVHVGPNPIGLNQQAIILVQVDPSPPTATFDGGDRWLGITVAVTKPDGTLETLGPFVSNASGMALVYYHPSQTGTYTVVSKFPGQTLKTATTTGTPGVASEYVNDTFLSSASNPFALTVQQQVTATPTPSPIPIFSPQPTPTPRPTPQLSTTPSIPDFSLRYVPSPYEIVTTDPYTGENASQRVESSVVEIIIKNPTFASYHDPISGSDISLYYNVRMKGHFGSDWQELYTSPNFPSKSNSEYTALPYFQNLPAGSQIDFQVQAIVGSWSRVFTSSSNNPGSYQNTFMVLATSDWSTTQTKTLPEPSRSPSPSWTPVANPAPTETQTAFPAATSYVEPTPPPPVQTFSPEPTSQSTIPNLYLLITTLVAAVVVLVILLCIVTIRIRRLENKIAQKR